MGVCNKCETLLEILSRYYKPWMTQVSFNWKVSIYNGVFELLWIFCLKNHHFCSFFKKAIIIRAFFWCFLVWRDNSLCINFWATIPWHCAIDSWHDFASIYSSMCGNFLEQLVEKLEQVEVERLGMHGLSSLILRLRVLGDCRVLGFRGF